MKKYVNILFAAAVAALALVSCAKEQEVAPGTPDAEDCYGVYFPKQDVIEEMQVLDPTQEKEVIIKVARGVSDGALTVKPTVSLSEITANGLVDGDVSLFTVPDIVFEDGQAETDLKIVFPNVKEGVQYCVVNFISKNNYVTALPFPPSVRVVDFKGVSYPLAYPGGVPSDGADRRHLLFWHPALDVPSDGMLRIPLTMPSYPGVFRVQVEGWTADGQPVSACYRFEVE